MNITITGNLGSGKTTICNELKTMGYNIISAGDLFRSVAKERGLSVVELNELVNKEAKQGSHEIDDMIDNRSIELGQALDNTVFDSRMAWNFVKPSFKVFLTVSIDEAATRIFNADRETERYDSIETCRSAILERQLLEQERFSQLYGVDYYNMNNFNLIIETTTATPKEIAARIADEFEKFKEQHFTQKILLNPKSIYPTQAMRDFNNNTLIQYINDTAEQTYGKINVTTIDNEWYVLDGHHRWIGTLIHKTPFVEVAFKPGEFAISKPTQNELYDFEDMGMFRYKKYPSTDHESQLLNFTPDSPTPETDIDENYSIDEGNFDLGE